ncbi:hypothetical protein CLV58_109167 [Spirosoma oryzae]|uniref:Uncharacterized protein n=1 Tax=Spirosoma oryzae TaxID=1469603 RepID=A0A2T0SYF1_9BACT|nr:hypothetical protein [Spirosoma oryzae]PRY38440.1 hypothetical protein CLV58_109167 [Spirosoma oryzae]
MACQPANPCQKPTCTRCQGTGSTTPGSGTGLIIDSSQVIYHLTPGQTSKLICLALANGVSLETILERIDQALCARSLPEPAKLNLACFLQNKPAPATMGGLLEAIGQAICNLRTATDIGNLIQQLLASSVFVSGLATLIATNPSFISTLLANQSFLSQLAASEYFVSQLANNPSFITQVGTKLVNDSHFVSSLVQKITTDPTLKEQFCCDTGGSSPCQTMIVGGVPQVICSCQAPTSLLLTGPATGSPDTDLTYQLSYAGTPGHVSWSIAGGQIQSQTDTAATVRFSQSGSLTATVTGCDGNNYPVSKQTSIGPACIPVSGLTITGQIKPIPGTSVTYQRAVTAGTVLSHSWTISGGIITGSASGESVTVTWTGNGIPGVLSLSVNDCSGSAKTTQLSVAPQQLTTEQIGELSASCRISGSCNDNGLCSVRHLVSFSGLQPNLGYSAELETASASGASLTVLDFNQSSTTAVGQLVYTQLSGTGSYSGALVLKQGGQTIGSKLLTLTNSSSFAALPSCQSPATVQPTNSAGQYTVSFDDTGLTPPYTYTLKDQAGTTQASGSL